MQPQSAIRALPDKSPLPSSGALNLAALRDSLQELTLAATSVADMQAAYRDLLHAISKKSGLAAPVIRSYVAARLTESDKARYRKKERAQQLSLLFDEVAL